MDRARASAFPVLLGLVLLGSCLTVPAIALADEPIAVDLNGYIEGRGIVASDTATWEDRGLGKTRYGVDPGKDTTLVRGMGALALDAKLGFDLSAHVVVEGASDQATAFDITEAYFQYKPAPTHAFGFRAKAGVFFPPISLENDGLAWTSPYTITPSAINSWVGQELRTIGGEATVFHQSDDLEIDLTGGVFAANETAGTMITWVGWTFDDHVTGLFDRLALPPLPILQPTGILFKQGPDDEPFHEFDGRVGTYATLTLAHTDYGRLSAMWYDNHANDHAFEDGEWSWHTKFWSFGYETDLPAGIKLLSQYMTGHSTVISLPEPIGPLDYTDFWSAYGLVSKDWGRNRFSFRFDHFVTSRDDTNNDDTNEHGNALTFAYILRPTDNQRLTLELLHINSTRPERAALGLPVSATENQIQASWRFFFGTGH